MATTFMGLTLPTPGVTIGDDWAEQLNTAITTIDSHDHTSGKGDLIPVAGLNINDNIDLSQNNIENTSEVGFYSVSVDSSNTNTAYVKSGDLYFKDSGGNAVRITSGGALNVGSVGGIGGDYGTTSATAFYTDASLTYFFQDSAASAAKLDIGDLDCEDISATGSITAGTGYTATTGNITATTGDLIATAGNIKATVGNIQGDTITDAAGTGSPTLTYGAVSSDAIHVDNITDEAGTGAPTLNGQTILDSTPTDPNVRAGFSSNVRGSGNKISLAVTGHAGQNNLINASLMYLYNNTNGTTMQTRITIVIKDTTSGYRALTQLS